jgi:lipoate-protein ligase A
MNKEIPHFETDPDSDKDTLYPDKEAALRKYKANLNDQIASTRKEDKLKETVEELKARLAKGNQEAEKENKALDKEYQKKVDEKLDKFRK